MQDRWARDHGPNTRKGQAQVSTLASAGLTRTPSPMGRPQPRQRARSTAVRAYVGEGGLLTNEYLGIDIQRWAGRAGRQARRRIGGAGSL